MPSRVDGSGGGRFGSSLPPSTWRMHTRHLLYPSRPEEFIVYSRSGVKQEISDRLPGHLVDIWV